MWGRKDKLKWSETLMVSLVTHPDMIHWTLLNCSERTETRAFNKLNLTHNKIDSYYAELLILVYLQCTLLNKTFFFLKTISGKPQQKFQVLGHITIIHYEIGPSFSTKKSCIFS